MKTIIIALILFGAKTDDLFVKTHIGISVSSKNKSLESECYVKLCRQLRSIKEVTIMKDSDELYLQVVLIPTNSIPNQYALSATIIRRFLLWFNLWSLFPGKFDPNELLFIKNLYETPHLGYLVSQNLYTGSDINRLCERLVIDIEADFIEPKRQKIVE